MPKPFTIRQTDRQVKSVLFCALFYIVTLSNSILGVLRPCRDYHGRDTPFFVQKTNQDLYGLSFAKEGYVAA